MYLEDPWAFLLRRREVFAGYDDATETIITPTSLTDGMTDSHVIGHELAHHIQLVTTPYGSFVSYLEWKRWNHFLRFFRTLVKSGYIPPLKLPITYLLDELQGLNSSVLNDLLLWNHCVRVKSALEGNKEYRIEDVADSLKAIYSDESMGEGASSQAVSRLNSKNFFALPNDFENLHQEVAVQPRFAGQLFGALQILEGLAFIGEYVQSGYGIDVPRQLELLKTKNANINYSQEYQSAFLLFLQSLLVNRLDDTMLNEALEKPMLLTAFVSTFSAAAHLALMTPLHFRFHDLGFSETKNLTWFDLHPGWRFFRICRQLEGLSVKEWVDFSFSNYESIQNKICKALGWPNPSDFRELAQRYKSTNRSEVHFFTHLALRTLRSMEASKDAPWAFVFPASRYPGFDPKLTAPAQEYVISNYSPNFISKDLGVTPGWYVGKDVSSVQSFIANFIVRKWFDYIICNETLEFDLFFESIFPEKLNWRLYRDNLISDIDRGMFALTGSYMRDCRLGKRGIKIKY